MNFWQIGRHIDGKVGVLEVATKSSKNVSSGYTEDWLPVRGIQNNMIITKDNYKVTGVKISPKNIFILDPIAQDNMLISLKNFYNTIDFEFWLVVADRPVDINLYLSQLQLLYNSTQDNVRRKMIMDDINKANMFMNNNVVDTEYFLLFKERNDEVIQKRIRNLINSLAGAGLSSHQVSNEDLRMILDNFLNGGQTTTFGTVLA